MNSWYSSKAWFEGSFTPKKSKREAPRFLGGFVGVLGSREEGLSAGDDLRLIGLHVSGIVLGERGDEYRSECGGEVGAAEMVTGDISVVILLADGRDALLAGTGVTDRIESLGLTCDQDCRWTANIVYSYKDGISANRPDQVSSRSSSTWTRI